jgi:hypothetical protein
MRLIENAHALVIGIANYQHINKLPQTVTKDARDVYELLTDARHCGYASNNVKLLINDQATKQTIQQAFIDLAVRCDSDSTVFIYISSHGGRIESGPYAGEFLLPVDALYNSGQSLAQTAISSTELMSLLQAIPARKLVVIFDCCHAGGIGELKATHAPTLKTGFSEHYYETLQTGRGRVILASSRSTEFSYILPEASNSLFTKYMLDGFRGGAIGSGGVIRIFDLFNYLQPKVTDEQPNQHPILKAEVEENFPIALYMGGKSSILIPTGPSADDFIYDAFISYRHQDPDKAWTRRTLVPRLQESGIRVCIDYRDFRPGALLLLEMERAIEQSRYTLAVLSPAYLKSDFVELENVMAQHLGLELSQRRLITIMREASKPRLGLRARMWLDFKDDDELDVNIARLVYELHQSPKL